VHHHHPGMMRSHTPVNGRYLNPSQQATRSDNRISRSSVGTDVSSLAPGPGPGPGPGFHRGPAAARLYPYPTGSTGTGFYSDAASAGSIKSFATVSTMTPQNPQQLHAGYNGGYNNVHPPPRKQGPGSALLAPPPRHASRSPAWSGPQYPALPSQQPPHPHTSYAPPAHPPSGHTWRKPTPWKPTDGLIPGQVVPGHGQGFPGQVPAPGPSAGRPGRPTINTAPRLEPGQTANWNHVGGAYPVSLREGPAPQWANV
jgi:hypothetical protein